MPRRLPDELLEAVLRRLPPQEPADLVRAALVSRRWCRLVSDPGFRRRFREFHRSPPMLGIVCGFHGATAEFIPTTAFRAPRTEFQGMGVLDARHGRVLFGKGRNTLAVWDPITNVVVREFPFPEKRWHDHNIAILCSAAAGAICGHLDCHQGPFQVVYVGTNKYDKAEIYTYSSDAAAWSEPVTGQDYIFTSSVGSARVGNTLYFCCYAVSGCIRSALKYNFESRQVSMIQLPSSLSMESLRYSTLTTTEDGGLGLVTKDDCMLYVWSREDTHEVDAIWERKVTIELNTVFHVDVDVGHGVDVTQLVVIGSGVGIIFMRSSNEAYTVDLKTYEVKKICDDEPHTIFPYMSFYTPALEATCSGEEPSAGGSSVHVGGSWARED